MRKPANLLIKLLGMALCAGLLVLWVILLLPCPIRHFTGIICPGCGMGRAWLAVFRLDFGQAFQFHPLFWSVPVLAWLVLYDCRPFRKRWLNILTPAVLLGGLLVCYLVRLHAFLNGALAL